MPVAGPWPALQWKDVALPPGAQPVALTGSRHGQVFVLDAGNALVLVLNADGARVTEWKTPSGDFRNGDISVGASGGNLVHICNASGTVYTYLP